MDLTLVLGALAVFEGKHFLCDFVLQPVYGLSVGTRYGVPRGFILPGLHALGSVPAMLFLTSNVGAIALLLLAEFVLTYHAAWARDFIVTRERLDQDNMRFWTVVGAEQALHQFAYIVLAALLARV